MRIRMPIAIVAAAFFLLCAAPAGAVVDVAGWELTDLSATQIPITFRLAFDEQRIAWPRWDGSQTDVYVVDVATGTTTQITATPESEESVDLDGSRLVWLARTNEDLSAPVEVRLHDLETNETRVIGSGRVQLESGPLLVGDHVAWAQYQPISEGKSGLRLALYAHTISNQSTVQITDQVSYSGGYGGQRSFSLDDTHLAFVKDGPPGQEAAVWLYALTQGSSTELGSSAVDSRHVSLEGDLVAWAAEGGPPRGSSYASYRILTHSISTGQTRQIAAREGPEPYPQTDGRFVVWDTYHGDLRTIEAYDTQTGQLVDVSDNRFLNFTPEISDGLVVWERGGELDSEIMVHDLLSGQTTQLSANRVWMDQASQAHGRTVVWWKYWFSMEPGPQPPDEFVVATAPDAYVDPFNDVDGLHRYRTAIDGLYEQAIVEGYLIGDDRFFQPETSLLRAQFAKMVCEAFDVPVTEDMASGFTDLGEDDQNSLYPHEYVAALSAQGILKGVGGGRFDPYSPLTRAQAASILVRALDAVHPGLLTQAGAQPPGAYNWEPPHVANLRRAYANDLLSSLVDWMQRWDAGVTCDRGEASQLVWNCLALVD